MDKIIFGVFFILTQTICFSQEKSFKDYYTDTKELTQNLKTYKIIVCRKDTSFTLNSERVRHQLKKAFSFLQNKEEVKENRDLLLKVVIADTNIRVNYTLRNSDADYDRYNVRWLYDLSFSLEFEVQRKEKINMLLCDYKHYEKPSPNGYFGYNIERSNPFNRNNQYYRYDEEYLKIWGSIEGRVSLDEIFLEKKADFSDEFSLVFRKFIRG